MALWIVSNHPSIAYRLIHRSFVTAAIVNFHFIAQYQEALSEFCASAIRPGEFMEILGQEDESYPNITSSHMSQCMLLLHLFCKCPHQVKNGPKLIPRHPDTMQLYTSSLRPLPMTSRPSA